MPILESQIKILNQIPLLFATLFGIFILGSGINSILNPQAFSGTLGIPVSTSDSQALAFVSFAGARNVGLGLTVLVLLLMH
jgi:hypothetical protein